jgi:hypothetical protein
MEYLSNLGWSKSFRMKDWDVRLHIICEYFGHTPVRVGSRGRESVAASGSRLQVFPERARIHNTPLQTILILDLDLGQSREKKKNSTLL